MSVYSCAQVSALNVIIKMKKNYSAILILMLAAAMLTGCTGADRYALRDNGIELYNSGNYAGAIEEFDKALDASDGQVSDLQFDILKYKGECEIRTGDYAAAKDSYTALYELCKDDPDISRIEEIYNQLGALDKIKEAADLLKEGSYTEAYDAFSEYAELDGSMTGRAAVYNKAVCAEYLGNFDEAYELLKAYTDMYPDDEAAVKEAEFCRTRRKTE